MKQSSPWPPRRPWMRLTSLALLAWLTFGASAQDYPWEHGPGIFSCEWLFATGRGHFRASSPTLADVNLDGDLEICVGDLQGWVYVLDPQTGQCLPGWPQQLSAPIDSTPAVGDVDGDGRNEVVAGCGVADWQNFAAVGDGALYVFEEDGTLKWRHATDDWWNMANHVIGPDGHTESISASPTLADLDGDGVLEIVVGAQDGLLYAINADGTTVFADRAGNVVNSAVSSLTDRWFGSIWRWDRDGDGRWDEDPWGDQSPYPFGDIVPGYAGVDDDGDGWVDESLAGNVDDDEDSFNPGDDGTNWNMVDEDGWDFPFQLGDSCWPTPSVADLDGDGFLDIVQSSDISNNPAGFGHLYVLNRFARPLPAFGYEEVVQFTDALGRQFEHPGRIRGTVYRDSVWSQISLGDADGDGNTELYFGANHTVPCAGVLYGYRHDGTEIVDGDANPTTTGIFALTAGGGIGLGETIHGAPALGDLDGDGDLEIVAVGSGLFPGSEVGTWNGSGSAGVYAWHHDGTPVAGFPFAPSHGSGASFSSPILADLDGDGDLEILYVTLGGAIEVWHHTTEVVDGAPIYLVDVGTETFGFNPFSNSAAVGDIDNDGRVEILLAGERSSALGGGGGVLCLEAGAYNPAGMAWPMEFHDANHTGNYSPPLPEVIHGDVNIDGTVDVADVVSLLRQISNSHAVSWTNDINSDSELTNLDVDELITIILTQESPAQ